MRAFVAIALPREVRESLGDLVARLRASRARATWVHPDRMHLTLRFLGDVAPEPLERLRAMLREPLAAIDPFVLHVRGVGAFPSAARPSVLWAGVEPVDGPLAALQERVESASRAMGLSPETKPFRPHLTLARLRDKGGAAGLPALIPHESRFEGGAFTVEAVSLLSSELTPKGPIYDCIEEFCFCSTST